MFFPLLNQEEKESCLSLLVHAARCDDHFHEKEKNLIDGYSLLMGIAKETNRNLSIDDVIEYFANKSDVIRRAVFLETFGLILSDSIYHANEEKLIVKIANSFGLDSDYIFETKLWILEMLPLYYKGFELVGIKFNKS